MGAQLGAGEGAVADLNLTPLIDIVLVVLIIMMVNMPIQIEEMGVKLPGVSDSPPPKSEKTEQLVIAVYADGKTALNRILMDEERIFQEITRRLRSMGTKNVFVDADATIGYGRVVDMVDLAREAGAAKVGLAKMKDEGPAVPTGVAEGSGLPRGITFGSPRVVGAISEKKADAAIQPLKASFMSCYNQALGRNPRLNGRMLLKTTIGPEGEHMEEAEISAGTTIEDPALNECINQYLPNIAYEPLGEGKTAVVQYQLLFSPG
ncbi:MAG: biopolymer transport protein ExbD [Myxococcota bacterium]|jgi:biopolymer transport protein ExbD